MPKTNCVSETRAKEHVDGTLQLRVEVRKEGEVTCALEVKYEWTSGAGGQNSNSREIGKGI